MGHCPECGSEELVEIPDSGNAYCPDCGEVVEPDEGWDEFAEENAEWL